MSRSPDCPYHNILDRFDSIDFNERSVKLLATGFATLGAYYLGKNIYHLLKGFTKYMVLPRRNLFARYGGGWALVTGASDGIGKEYCIQLARAGFNVVLMARDQAKLDAVAKELRDVHKVATKTVVYDFSKLSSEQSAEELKALLEMTLKGIDLSILVNNVGCAKFGKLQDHSIWDSMRQINVNVNSQTYMSMFCVPKLLARSSRSAMINVSSVAAYYPGGMVPVYCATKSFNWVLSESMRDAYADKIDILTVTPANTKTQMNSGRYLFSVTAEQHARETINQLGWQNVTRGSYVHALQPRLKAIWPIGSIVEYVNSSRRAAWQAEEAAKKKAADEK